MIRYLLLLPSGFWLAPWPKLGTRDIDEAARLTEQEARSMATKCTGAIPYRIETVGNAYAIEDLRNHPLYLANTADAC